MPKRPSDRWPQIEQLYHRALEHDEATREAFLDETCADDDALRREVRSLLVLEGAADRFLERPALAEAAAALARDPQAGLTGRRLDGYEVSTLLGTGGMGEVYRARDVRLGREVALKVLEPTIAADPAYLRRFEEEARSASVLNHPNIVTVYGVGEEGEIAFIAMELVQGRTLRERISTKGLPIRTALDIAIQLADALAAAHASGIVHRDLKPENVMVTPEGLVKVLDFGIARRGSPIGADAVAGDRTETRAGLTEVGAILGTVGYMSPEQAVGQPARFTSDQFSFGAILYEMLSGRRAFQRDSKIATLSAIIDSQPEPIEHLNAAVTTPVRRLLERCLAKDASARYSNTRDLARELREIRDSWEHDRTGVDPPASEFARGLTRRRALWLGGATAVAATAAVATWQLWPQRAGLQSIAVLPFANAAKDDDAEYLCDGITESLIQRLSRLPITVMARSLVFNFKGTTDARAAGRQLGVQAILTGAITRRSGGLMITAELVDVASGASLWSNTYDRASADILAMQYEIATAIADKSLRLPLTREQRRLLRQSPTDNPDAYDLFIRARPLQMGNSESEYLAARGLLERAVAKDPKFTGAWVALAATYWTTALDNFERPTDAWPQFDRCLQQARALDRESLGVHTGLATRAAFYSWDWAEAEREFRAATTAKDSDLQPELLLHEVLFRWAIGHADESLRLVQRARILDPLSPVFVDFEARFRFQTGSADEASRLLLELVKAHPENANYYFDLADVLSAQEKFDEAITIRRQAHELAADDALRDVLAKARGEAGYHHIEREAVRLVELRNLERRVARGGYASPCDFARAYARLGDKEHAFEYLAAAFNDRAPGLVFLKVDRAWDSIRDDTRFRAAVTKVGLP